MFSLQFSNDIISVHKLNSNQSCLAKFCNLRENDMAPFKNSHPPLKRGCFTKALHVTKIQKQNS